MWPQKGYRACVKDKNVLQTIPLFAQLVYFVYTVFRCSIYTVTHAR